MKKILLNLMILLQCTFAATPEQVEQYIMLSQADRDLVQMEQMLDEFIPSNLTKSTEVIASRFNEYLEKNLSEQEVSELIDLYKNPLLQTLRELDSDIPEEELQEFNLSLQENPLSSERLDLNNEIIENMVDDEDLKNMLHGLEEKILKLSGEENHNEKVLTEEDEKAFLSETRETFRLPMLYTTQTLSLEELNELKDLTNTSLIKKANKVEFHGMMYAIDEFLVEMIQGMRKQFMNEAIKEDSLSETFVVEE
ncbi:MAG TPA: hypothetical protein ENK82_06120 [Campylobacterales bacterium]|nr:hypothetical protein [Campylobacterales bacterium]HHS92905.1 hypothetical protein [Campylobacterales bacterium]